MPSPADIAKLANTQMLTITQKRELEAERLLAEHAKANAAKAPIVEAFKNRMQNRKRVNMFFLNQVIRPIWKMLYETYWQNEDAKRAAQLGLTLEEAYALYLPHKLKNKKSFGKN